MKVSFEEWKEKVLEQHPEARFSYLPQEGYWQAFKGEEDEVGIFYPKIFCTVVHFFNAE